MITDIVLFRMITVLVASDWAGSTISGNEVTVDIIPIIVAGI